MLWTPDYQVVASLNYRASQQFWGQW